MNATALQECLAALESPNVRAFLRVIRDGETDQTDAAYRTIVGGERFDGFDDHPRRMVWLPKLKVNSSAAGAYQFLSRTWDGIVKQISLPDFSPAMQDVAAVYLIRGRGALGDVLAGEIPEAIRKCALEWASLPGSPYGQPTRTLSRALEVYRQWGGKLASDANAPAPIPAQPEAPSAPPAAPQPDILIPPAPAPAPAPAPTWRMPAGDAPDWTPPPEAPMPIPAILAGLGRSIFVNALPSIVSAIPKLGGIFGSGSEVANRNIKAVEVVAETIGAALDAKNAQELVEAMNDPAKVEAARQAVAANWATITEVVEGGGGGITGARDFIAKSSDNPDLWKIIKVVTYAALGFLLLANVIAIAAWSVALWRDVGLESATQFLAQVITADIGAAMTALGFWLGSSWGSKRKEAAS